MNYKIKFPVIIYKLYIRYYIFYYILLYIIIFIKYGPEKKTYFFYTFFSMLYRCFINILSNLTKHQTKIKTAG